MNHKPVLVNQVLSFFDYLKDDKKEKTVADFTLGGGGHTKAILEKFENVKVVGFDKDDFALSYSSGVLGNFKDRIDMIKADFSEFDSYLKTSLDGALVDLGISSFHVDDKRRGFSFESNERLDMRMDRTCELSAYEVVNRFEFLELQQIFKEFGEIKMPNRVINAIIAARKKKPIETCKELAEIINRNYFSKNRKINPATKFFQAIRIYVNNELNSLKIFLSKIFDYLNLGSRLQIISFHSLEDRIVKNVFRYESLKCVCPENVLVCNCGKKSRVKILTRKPVVADENEIAINKRSRSAKLRVAEIIDK